MGPTSEIVLAASPKPSRKASSVIAVRANPTMAYRGPSALCVARSYIAGMTLRLARSPEAPNKTTVQGSATPPYTEPPAIVSPSSRFKACPFESTESRGVTIPQHRIFEAPRAIAPRPDDGSCSFLAFEDIPGSAGGHQ